MARSRTSPEGPRRRTFAGFLWFWGKVLLCLALFDVLLFRTGWVWHLKHGDALRSIAERIENPRAHDPVAVIVGSSVVRRGVSEPRVNSRLSRWGIPSSFENFGMDGTYATEAALISHSARTLEPWLVIYGATFRAFMRNDLVSPLQPLFVDSTFDLEAMAPDSIDEYLVRLVRTHWRLYRYRDYVRARLREEARSLIDVLVPSAEAKPLPARNRRGKSGFDPMFEASPSFPAWKRWYRSRSFADYERYLAARGRVLALYRKHRVRPFDLRSNPQVEALDHLLRTSRARGTRVVLVYFPENPIFRDPQADEYFDPQRSDAVAALMAREAAKYGARFVDLRQLLPAEDFVDLLHANEPGVRLVTRALTVIIAQEWAAANQDAMTEGTVAP